MIAVSLMIEGQLGLNWTRWQRLAAEVEDLGFAGLFRSDHFVMPRPPDEDSLDMLVSLAYLAARPGRIHFGPLVAPISFRDPRHLARQAAAIDDLSGGRLILGLGAGWNAREHEVWGFDLGDIPTRMARFEEGLEVVTRLLGSDTPVTHDGRFYQLRGAAVLPRPARPHGPPILIGGNGPRRTLPLVARYADIWNAVGLSPEDFRARSATLDDLLRTAGRPPDAIQRTAMTMLIYGQDSAALARRLAGMARTSPEAPVREPLDAQITYWRAHAALVGTAAPIREQIAAYAAAGVTELMLQWLDLDDLAGLRAFAREVLPHLGA